MALWRGRWCNMTGSCRQQRHDFFGTHKSTNAFAPSLGKFAKHQLISIWHRLVLRVMNWKSKVCHKILINGSAYHIVQLSFKWVFRRQTKPCSPIDMSVWDASQVSDMSSMFSRSSSFNQPIGDWNTSKVTDMSSMFSGAKSFNQDLSNWKVDPNVKDCDGFSSGASSWELQQPLFTSCIPS